MIYIFLPVHNESWHAGATHQVMRLFCVKHLEYYKVIFINDHSTDDTLLHLKFSPNVINNESAPGKGSALKFGYLKTKPEIFDTDIVIFLDGDGQIDNTDILTGLDLMRIYNADAVIGNKRHKYSLTKYGFLRSVVSLTYNFLVRLLFQINFEDTQCGLKIFKGYAIASVIDEVDRNGFAFDIDLIMALRRKNYRIVDCPVKVNKQLNSGSVNLKNIFNVLFDTLYVLFKS